MRGPAKAKHKLYRGGRDENELAYVCAISQPTKTPFIARVVKPRDGIALQWWIVDRGAHSLYMHITAMQLQRSQKKRK